MGDFDDRRRKPKLSELPSDLRARHHAGGRAVMIGILASVALSAIKIFSGVVGHSFVLVADGIESIVDVFSGLVVIQGMRAASKAPTERHPYGFGNAEPMAALTVGFSLLIASVAIAAQSVQEILHPHQAPEAWTLAVIVVVVLAKETMFRLLRRQGQALGSSAIDADAWHHRSDALTSAAAFVGIAVALFAGPKFAQADDWAALAASAAILFNGGRITLDAARSLLDEAPEADLSNQLAAIALAVEGVVDIEHLRARRSGLGVFVDLHVEVDAEMTVREGHEIAHSVKNAILRGSLPIVDVIVHIEPASAEEKQADDRSG